VRPRPPPGDGLPSTTVSRTPLRDLIALLGVVLCEKGYKAIHRQDRHPRGSTAPWHLPCAVTAGLSDSEVDLFGGTDAARVWLLTSMRSLAVAASSSQQSRFTRSPRWSSQPEGSTPHAAGGVRNDDGRRRARPSSRPRVAARVPDPPAGALRARVLLAAGKRERRREPEGPEDELLSTHGWSSRRVAASSDLRRTTRAAPGRTLAG